MRDTNKNIYLFLFFMSNIQSVFDKTSWNHIQENINANE